MFILFLEKSSVVSIGEHPNKDFALSDERVEFWR